MFARIATRPAITAVVIGTFLSLIIMVGHAQAAAPLSEVKAIVFDETGAVIPDCEIVFRSNSETSVLRTGLDGAVTVKLRKGRYVVTAKKAGFAESKMIDVQIGTPMPDTLRIVLKADFTPISDGLSDVEVPTTSSDLPSVIGSSAPTTRQRRSWHCLYLWKCSTS